MSSAINSGNKAESLKGLLRAYLALYIVFAIIAVLIAITYLAALRIGLIGPDVIAARAAQTGLDQLGFYLAGALEMDGETSAALAAAEKAYGLAVFQVDGGKEDHVPASISSASLKSL